jgi:hypothetical protein
VGDAAGLDQRRPGLGLHHLVPDPGADRAGEHDGELVLAGVVVGLDEGLGGW